MFARHSASGKLKVVSFLPPARVPSPVSGIVLGHLVPCSQGGWDFEFLRELASLSFGFCFGGVSCGGEL